MAVRDWAALRRWVFHFISQQAERTGSKWEAGHPGEVEDGLGSEVFRCAKEHSKQEDTAFKDRLHNAQEKNNNKTLWHCQMSNLCSI